MFGCRPRGSRLPASPPAHRTSNGLKIDPRRTESTATNATLLATPYLFVLTLSTSRVADVELAQPPAPTRPGVDVLLESPGLLQGRRIGLVTHAAGLTSAGEPTSSALLRDPRFTITALFAPEHGLSGTVPAGQPVPDTNGRVPVYSLYGATRRPTPR